MFHGYRLSPCRIYSVKSAQMARAARPYVAGCRRSRPCTTSRKALNVVSYLTEQAPVKYSDLTVGECELSEIGQLLLMICSSMDV
jgi:hypothetical protein